jgi:RNA polymerase sigma-70 factor (ECF subfamily)
MLCGLTAAETARLLATTEPTVAQRIVRAKRKIKDTGIAMTVPPRAEWPARLDAVMAVVGLLFTEGWAATEGPELVRSALCDEALRLSALLCRMLPDEAEVLGLAALLRFTDARRDARLVDGELVVLAEQDRALWRWHDIEQGLALVTRALRRAGDRPGRWVLHAAIAAVQVQPDGDPESVVILYDRLVETSPSPAAFLARAAAVAGARGPEAGLAALDGTPVGTAGHRHHVLRAELHHALGDLAAAHAHLAAALELTRNEVERRHLQRRLAQW